MAVRTREEILESLRGRFGDEPTDDDIAMLEDITDTFTDFEEKTSDATNWKNKYEENDKAWKKKYSDRFSVKTVMEMTTPVILVNQRISR